MATISYLLLVLFWSQLGMFGSHAVNIDMNPSKGIATMVDAIHISCLPDNLDDPEKEVTLIELSRNDQDPLVYVSHCGNVSFTKDSSRFQAVANIATDPSQSYLNVTLVYPESDDTGIYTCSLHYIDRSGRMKMETASENLLIENIDVKSLEKVLNQMGAENKKSSEMIKSLGEENKKSTEMIRSLVEENEKSSKMITSLGERVTSLGERVTSLEKENKDLKDKVFYTVAFMTTTKKMFTPSAGSVVILPDVIWSVGTGYDKRTGVFTAPVPGLYAFHVTVRNENGCGFYLELVASETILSRLFGYNRESWPQTSTSSVTDLQAGDEVFLKVKDRGCKLHNSKETFFTGYLIKTY